MLVTIFARNGGGEDERTTAMTTDRFMRFVVKPDQPLARHPVGARLTAFDFRLGTHETRPAGANQHIVAVVKSVKASNPDGSLVIELSLLA